MRKPPNTTTVAAATCQSNRKYHSSGVLLDTDKALSTRQLYRQTFATNVEGAAVLTAAFLPLLRKSAAPRLVFVSSRMGSLEQTLNQDTMYYSTDYSAYDASKAALNMLALNYVRIFGQSGKDAAKVNVACPGLVQTKLTGFTPYGQSVEVGAKRIVQLATLGEEGESGTFSDLGGAIPW
jgi:NAD(P)-dependent dehydrogenase (short-subunit alcohol dehydrogenase family)